MDGGNAALRDGVIGLVAEGYDFWETVNLPVLPISERYIISDESLSVYKGEHAVNLAVACQCFWLFRKLHGMTEENPVSATLLGDYFFSVFSKNLIPLDSVALNDEFARLLASDTQDSASLSGFMEFVRTLPAVLRSDQ